ncbi:TAP-like protein-domain-containing protein [Mycena maculata]|uniref:TAP-like protein-domain-containing protein n=1 Tax=Mycena maculata TaxID=230809 RepID=A0AAD7JXY2_9AGAR|nr:TAP-like protein-domain-containing protein [Mycena maculata]
MKRDSGRLKSSLSALKREYIQSFVISCLVLLLVTHLILSLDGDLPSQLLDSRIWDGGPKPNLIRKNSSLNWESCPDNSSFFCAFLTVPLDYSNRTTEDTAIIAMRMYPATVPPSQRLGTILTNPGGPGTSGHATLLKTGPSLSVIFHGKFDLVSWDPRGVNMSLPRISCHPTDLHRQLFGLGHNSGDLDLDNLPVSAANITLLRAAARARLLTELCRDAVGDKVLRSVTTVNGVRDLEEMRKVVGEGALIYWGFSYGTTLGATYAAMFPHHVGRMVLDGVVYTPEQYGSLFEHGISSGDSTGKVFDGFLSSCISAGPFRCSLLRNGTADPSLLAKRIWNLASHLRFSPLPVAHPHRPAVPSVVRPEDLILSIFAALLRPTNWANLASAIADLETGDGRAIAALNGAGGRAWDLGNITDAERAGDAGWGVGRAMGADEADMAVSCGDAPPFPEYEDARWTHAWLHWRDELVANDPLSGGIWFKKLVRCSHWGRVQPPPERYEGQWKMGDDLRPPRHPILFVSNTYDPVSPISSGRRMVDVFGRNNARLIENHAYGHCSVSQPSLCIAKAIREYVINGTLPMEDTVCEPDEEVPFPPQNGSSSVIYEGEDQLVIQGFKNLGSYNRASAI